MTKTKKTKATKKRALATIARELHSVLKRKTVDIIEAGKLLLEAQENYRGEFLSWLEREFRLSQRTAYNYINAAKFARKFATVANLMLAPSALYLLGGLDDDDTVFTPEVIAAIGAEAKKKWVDADRCREITEPRPAEPPAEETPEEEGAAEPGTEEPAADDPNAILDGPPPPLPPSPPPETSSLPRAKAQIEAFQDAIAALKPLLAKPDKFAGAVEQNELIEAADFLNAVAKRTPADPPEQGTAMHQLKMENLALQARVDERDERITELEHIVGIGRERIRELDERIAELEGRQVESSADTPSATPIEPSSTVTASASDTITEPRVELPATDAARADDGLDVKTFGDGCLAR